MKATYNNFVSKEDKKNLVSVGGYFSQQTATYTKDDYLTPRQVAKKFDIPLEKARKIMRNIMFKHAIFLLNGHKAPIVTNLGKNSSIYLHPMGIEAFKKHLCEQKD